MNFSWLLSWHLPPFKHFQQIHLSVPSTHLCLMTKGKNRAIKAALNQKPAERAATTKLPTPAGMDATVIYLVIIWR